MTVSNRDNQCSAGVSDFLEHSQNSLSNDEPKVNTGEANVLFSAPDSQCLAVTSELQELTGGERIFTRHTSQAECKECVLK